jgi:hypothetical protein
VRRGLVLRPQRLAGHHGFIGHGTAFGEGLRADGDELLLHPADADAKGQPPAGQHIQCRQHLGGEHRRAVRHHHDGGDDAQLLGARGDEHRLHQLLVPVGLGAGGKLPGLGIRVARFDIGGDDDMVADGDVVKAQRLGLGGDGGDTVRIGQRSADRHAATDLHLFHLPRIALGARIAQVMR